MKLKAIELFAGIGGFRLGLEAAGVNVVWSNDIDELACRVYQDNFGKGSIVNGDINAIKPSSIPSHDLLTAGFPCQPFSPAGKKQGVHDLTRGTLFEKIVDVLEYHQPKYFFLENVKRLLTMEDGKHFRIILKALTELDGYFVEWRVINSLHFGIPQNRERVFMVGSKMPRQMNFHETLENHGVLLTQEDLNDPFFESNHASIDKALVPIEKVHVKTANWGIAHKGKMHMHDLPKMANVHSLKKLKDVLQKNAAKEFDFTKETIERIKNSVKVDRFINGVEVLFNQGGGARLGYTVFGINGIASTLTASTSRHYERYKIGNGYRRLTNTEYARIMGFPDDWCKCTTTYNQYTLFGNAVVPVCIEWVVSRIGSQNIDFQQREASQFAFAF